MRGPRRAVDSAGPTSAAGGTGGMISMGAPDEDVAAWAGHRAAPWRRWSRTSWSLLIYFTVAGIIVT